LLDQQLGSPIGVGTPRRFTLWADSIPKLLQARLIEGFENYDIAHAPLRIADLGQTDFQLLIDVRRFRIATDPAPTAEIGLSARIVDKTGKVVASRLFEDGERFDKIEPPAAAAAFSDAFGRIAKDMIAWTVEAPWAMNERSISFRFGANAALEPFPFSVNRRDSH